MLGRPRYWHSNSGAPDLGSFTKILILGSLWFIYRNGRIGCDMSSDFSTNELRSVWFFGACYRITVDVCTHWSWANHYITWWFPMARVAVFWWLCQDWCFFMLFHAFSANDFPVEVETSPDLPACRFGNSSKLPRPYRILHTTFSGYFVGLGPNLLTGKIPGSSGRVPGCHVVAKWVELLITGVERFLCVQGEVLYTAGWWF